MTDGLPARCREIATLCPGSDAADVFLGAADEIERLRNMQPVFVVERAVTSEMIETAARALFATELPLDTWDSLGAYTKDRFRERAGVCLRAVLDTPAPTDEPTDDEQARYYAETGEL